MKALRHIVIADDDARDVELTMRALNDYNLGNRIDVVSDGAALLDYLECRGDYDGRDTGHPAVILLDLKMPKLDGLEVLERMSRSDDLRQIPVVVLTSSREEADLMESYRLNANAYVVKPVDFKEFVDAVKQLGVFWALLNEPPP